MSEIVTQSCKYDRVCVFPHCNRTCCVIEGERGRRRGREEEEREEREGGGEGGRE